MVFENDLIQLIQYSPLTEKVHERPLVMVPPCINKFYIMDLQPENSLVRYAIEQGHTVFMVSWRNVKPPLDKLTWDDYVETGVIAGPRRRRGRSRAPTRSTRSASASAARSSSLRAGGARGEEEEAGGEPHAHDRAPRVHATWARSASTSTRTSSRSARRSSPRAASCRGRSSRARSRACAPTTWSGPTWCHNYLKGQQPPAFDLLYWNVGLDQPARARCTPTT